MIAAAFDQDGYDEVILTPRSGDHGRDGAHFTYEKVNERATGIEPAWPAWKAGTLPLSYARVL